VRVSASSRWHDDRVPEDHAEVLAQLLAAFNAHDLDRIMGFFSDDCVLETPRGDQPWGTRFEGPAAVREGLAQRFSGLPDVHYEEDETWTYGNHGVSRWLLTGTTPEGDEVRVRGCDLFDLTDDGRIRRKDSYWKIVGS
jgi:ketosteroid isomerase-like protein